MNTNRADRLASVLRLPSLLIILALLLSLFGIQPALARPQDITPTISLYVSATTGSDTANNCATLATPCQTINYAISQASGTDEGIAVAAGTYTGTSGTEVVLINKSVSLLGGYDTGFTAQTGTSVIDGGGVRRGIVVQAGMSSNIERFTIQNGFDGTLGGGIYNAGILALSDSTLSGNSAGSGSAYTEGGGAIGNTGTLSIYSSTLNGNNTAGSAYGAAIHTSGTTILFNTTVTSNLPYEAIFVNGGTLYLHNSTVAYNPGSGIWVYSGAARMTNTILAQNTANTAYDCYGAITSDGYNLLGNDTGCIFTSTTGDQVGTSGSPINPRLMALADNGGPTQTRALSDLSPALNAGSPATMGDPTACEETDQRGVARNVDRCDIGAFEGSVPLVVSITLKNVSPTSASTVYYIVTFSSPVSGINTVAPYSDFFLTRTGLSTAKINQVTGSGTTYTVRVNTGTGNGTLRLDVVDDDTIIKNGSGVPLGGTGLGNGNFVSGATYTITRIATTVAPNTKQWDNTPTYKWTKVPQATQYNYQVYKGTKLLYTKTVGATACGSIQCKNTPTTVLAAGGYKWRVRALTQGTWKPFSAFRSFSIDKPRAGHWAGGIPTFNIPSGSTAVTNFTVRVYCNGAYRSIVHSSAPIINRAFSWSGTFQASGRFTSPTSARGTARLVDYPIAACGVRATTPLTSWTAWWQVGSTPTIILEMPKDPDAQFILGTEQILPLELNTTPEPILP